MGVTVRGDHGHGGTGSDIMRRGTGPVRGLRTGTPRSGTLSRPSSIRLALPLLALPCLDGDRQRDMNRDAQLQCRRSVDAIFRDADPTFTSCFTCLIPCGRSHVRYLFLFSEIV